MSSALTPNDQLSLNLSPINMYTVGISDHAGLRVYSDARPHNWKIADLQKGLIIVYDGTEMVGEGTGFGLPIVVCTDEIYFSGTSRVHLSHYGSRWMIRKEFVMDRISRNRFRNATLENQRTRSFFAHLADLYQRHSHPSILALKKMIIGTAFVETASLGKVIVTYRIDKERIRVKTDFNDLESKRIRKIFMLNEQGSRFFREYVDSQETKLNDGKIGAWDGIDAAWAGLIDPKSGLGFRLGRVEGCVLRRGREYLRNSLDWVGLDYEVDPENVGLEYGIEILGA